MATLKPCGSCGKPVAADAPRGLCPACLMKVGLGIDTATGEPADPSEGAGAAAFVPPPLEELARCFPQLEVLGMIGRGGMGVVYKARQPRLDRFVALKVLAREKERSPEFAERFTREARTLARLSHPNIVSVYDFGETHGLYYLVMEFVDGLNLRQLLQAHRMSCEQALAIVPKICEALQFAHEKGVVHRDIKPENVLVDKAGQVKIADFGIAKILGAPVGQASLTGVQGSVGTPHYMAPEQVEKPQTVDHRADIYSLGVVFYELLTGELPLGKFPPPSRKVRVDVRLDEVVLRALEKEPERRYQQASQVKTAVETIASTALLTPASGSAKAQPPARRDGVWNREKLVLGAVMIALSLLVGGIFWLNVWPGSFRARDWLGLKRSGAVSVPSVPASSGLVSWWRGEGDARDAFGSNHGRLVKAKFSTGQVGQAFSFDGMGSYLRIPASASLDAAREQGLTIEAWIRPADVSSEQSIVEWGSIGLQWGTGYRVCLSSFVSVGSGTGLALTTDRYQHVALTYDRLSKSMRLFLNGVPAHGGQPPGYVLETGADLYMGKGFRGQIDEAALYNRALSALEIQAICDAGSAGKPNPLASDASPVGVPAPSGLVGWWRGEGNASDEMGSSKGISASGLTYSSGKVGQAFNFTGLYSGVRLGNAPALQLQTFTIEAWVKRASATACTQDPAYNAHGPPNYAPGSLLSYGNNGYAFEMLEDGRLALGMVGMPPVHSFAVRVTDTNGFHHVAVTKSGSSVLFYVDGVAESTSYNATFAFTTAAVIGARGSDLARGFWGSIDELAIYDRALSAEEIQAIHTTRDANKRDLAPFIASPPAPKAGSKPPPLGRSVALLDFTADDNSFTNYLAARQFTAALQNTLPTDLEWEWVQREHLETAERALGLSLFHSMAGSDAVRRARWVKADWLVIGRFAFDAGGKRLLDLKLVDMQHANLLGHKTLPLFDGESIVTTPETLKAAARSLQQMLSEGKTRVMEDWGRIVVAPLFFTDLSGGGLRVLEREFHEHLARLAASNQTIRLLPFPNAYQALEETALAFSELAETKADACQSFADCYIWGTGSITKSAGQSSTAPPGGKARKSPAPKSVPTLSSTARLTLKVWNGAGEPKTYTQRMTRSESGTFSAAELTNRLDRMLENVLSLAPSADTNARLTDSPAIRKRIAASFLADYEALATEPRSLPDREEERLINGVHLLEAACFFDSDNAVAHAMRISTRWGGEWIDFRFAPHKREFWSHWRRSEEWRKYVDHFDLREATILPLYDSIAQVYRNSASEVAEFRGNGFPTDLPKETEAALREWLALEARSRQQRVADYEREHRGEPKPETPPKAAPRPPMNFMAP